MEPTPEQRYLELLKQALTYSLWPEPPAPISIFDHDRPPFKRLLSALAARLLGLLGLELARRQPSGPREVAEGRLWPRYADTMIGLKRLDNLQECLETVLREGVAGDLIETGVWRGGACIFMRGVLAVYGDRARKVYVADSFQGLPRPNPEQYPADRGDRLHQVRCLAVSQAEVERNFRRYGLLGEQVVFLPGWFKDTLPRGPLAKLALMRLDGDLYESTMDALSNLYPKLSPGGFCLIDDYALPGCRRAVDDFRAAQAIGAELKTVDWTGAYWRKP